MHRCMSTNPPSCGQLDVARNIGDYHLTRNSRAAQVCKSFLCGIVPRLSFVFPGCMFEFFCADVCNDMLGFNLTAYSVN
jgi:hypothetical protein